MTDKAVRRRHGYRLTVVEPDDLHEVAHLLTGVFSEERERWLLRFEHWWTNNPAWNPEIPRGWVVRDPAQQTVGFLANIPFLYAGPGGERLLGCSLSTLAVHESVRIPGLSRRLADASMAQAADFVIGTESSMPAWRTWLAAGMKELNADWPRDAFFILGSLKSAAGKAIERSRLNSAPVQMLAGLVAGPVDWLINANQWGKQTLTVENVTQFSVEDEGDLLKLAAGPELYRPVRDTETLNWLYFGSEELLKTRVVLIARRQGRLVGYLGMKRRGDAFFLLECRVEGEDRNVVSRLLQKARRHAVSAGATHIRVHPFSPSIRVALPKLLSFRVSAWFTYCYLIKRDGLEIDQIQTGSWDGDTAVT